MTWLIFVIVFGSVFSAFLEYSWGISTLPAWKRITHSLVDITFGAALLHAVWTVRQSRKMRQG